MKKASKKLFRSPNSRDSHSVNGRTSFSSAAASALSLSPVAEDDNDRDLHRSFFAGIEEERSKSRPKSRSRTRSKSRGRNEPEGSHAREGPRGSGGSLPPKTLSRSAAARWHPHEIDREVPKQHLIDSIHSDPDAGRRRRGQQQEQFDKWAARKQKSSEDLHSRGETTSPEKRTTRKTHSFNDAYGDYDRSRKARSAASGVASAPPPLPYGNDDEYPLDEDDPFRAASSKQQKVIDNYVQRVIANADNEEYVTPLPRMDSGRDFFQSDNDLDGSSRRSSRSANGKDQGENLLPLPGFGEVDLLQRAIERRAVLHDRIVKMEAASAELAREEEQRTLKKKKSREGKVHRSGALRRSGGSGGSTPDRSREKSNRRASIEETDERMDRISERIKAEALEFLSFESTFVPTEDDPSNLTDEGEVSNATKECSDEEAMDPPENNQVTPPRQQLQQQHLEQQDFSMDRGPTPQQLSRYSNMVRLGIPDLAVLRSMEREGIATSQCKSILERLKNQHEIDSSEKMEEDTEQSREVWRKKEGETEDHLDFLSRPATNGSTAPNHRRKDSFPPLKDDPNYNKYFKMLKAKVPLSWVKRVLEVDGKDARVLDLDPDKPLAEQIAGAGVDENGNVDWSKVVVFRTGSEKSVESEGDEIIGKMDRRGDGATSVSSNASDIHLEAVASVKAELAIMTAKAGLLSREPLNFGQSGYTAFDAKERKPSAADISTAAAAASKDRLERLRAMTTPDRTGNRKKTVDEIRRRPPAVPPRTPKQTVASPTTSSVASNDRSERASVSRRQNFDHLPLKDDPRFAKYFQMIRSRVPRSWVERVIEVDDRDPAILDLDPNKPLAAQVEDEDSKSLVKTIATEDGSLDDSMPSGLDVSISRSSPINPALSTTIDALSPTEDLPESRTALDEILAGTEDVPPITQIKTAAFDDDRSVASSITNFRDGPGSQAEQSNVVFDRVAAFLEKIEARTKGLAETKVEEEPADVKQPPRFSSQEEIESKLANLFQRYGTKAEADTSLEEVQSDVKDERRQFLEDHHSDIAKLSALLAAKLGQQPDAVGSANSGQTPAEEQSELAKLSSLLTEVLSKMDGPTSDEQEAPDPAENDSAPKKLRKNSALEALLSKQMALAEERGDPILREDPEYQKYFKMQKLGLPRPTIEQALERDGKDVSILDLDPDLPLAEQKNKKPNKNAALEALFANRAAALKPKEPDVPLKNDPEYQKYFKMLKVGMPRDAVAQALERDGKSVSVLDLDPEKPYASQMKKESVDEARDEVEEKISDPPLKDDPEYAKFFKMMKMGIPLGAVKQALQKEGKDPSIIDLDPEKSYSSQVKDEAVDVAELPLKDDPEYAKFFKMLKMGIPLGAVKQALKKEGKDPSIIDLDPEKSYSSQTKDKTESKVEVPLKDDPEYAKFFKMLKMGIPIPAVKQALQKEGKDPNIIDMDPDKPLSQIKSEVPLKDDPEYAKFFKMLKMGIPLPAVKQAMQKEGKDPNIIDMDPEKPLSQTKAEVPLKDDPEYAKFFKMLKMGIPLPAVKQALQKEGKDPSIIDMDPEKPLSQQQSGSKQAKPTKVNNAPKVARKRLHWNKIDESKLNENCFWSQAKGEHASLQLVGLDIDNEEFDALFTSSVNKSAAPKKDKESEAKKPVGKQKIQLIDGRRRMNGSILLKKFKVDFKVLARQVDNMEYVEAEGNELRGLMQLLPTKDESLALRSYLPPVDAPQAEIDEAIDKLGECEQYMATMLDIPDAKEKFQCMLFRAEFEQHVDSIRDGTKLLIVACESVQNSERFKKLLMYALKLGNAMNTGGSEVSAITLDSLLKLAEAKAFDRQTSVLHYLVSIVSKNDEDVLRLSEDFGPVKAAERVAVDMLSQQLKELANGTELIKQMAIKYAPDSEKSFDKAEDELTDDELLSVTPMGKFSLTSESKITSLMNEFGGAKSSFADLLEFFGEDETLTTEAFFCTINTFVAMFDQTYKELKRKEEAKERKKRIEEKRKLREGAMKQVKATS